MTVKSIFRSVLKKLPKPQSGWIDIFPAIIGKADGTVLTPISGEIYVRNVLNGQTLTVINNNAVPNTFGLQVEVGRRIESLGIWQVKGQRQTFSKPASAALVPYHKEQHIFPAPDAPIFPRKQIRELTVLVQSPELFIVQVYGAVVRIGDTYIKIDSQTVDLSAHVPTTGTIYVNIESDDAGVLTLHDGSDFLSPELGTAADIPIPDTGQYRIATVMLFESQTVLLDSHIILPIFLEGVGTGTTGGGAVESVTGDGVDNTDPANPVISYPTPADIGADIAGAASTAQSNAEAYADSNDAAVISAFEAADAAVLAAEDTNHAAIIAAYEAADSAVLGAAESYTDSGLSAKLTANSPITGATKTKITYDTNGLVTVGANATTADIADSTNKRYVTDAQQTVIGNTSGTNTGDQTIALTGDVTGSGTGSFAATIANDAVTYAKMQNVSATDKVLGRSSSGAGDVEEIALTSAGRALIDDADAATQRATLGLVIGTNVQAQSSHRNFLCNSGFDIWQRRGTPSTLTAHADDTYGADAWNMLTNGGSTDIQDAQVSGDTDSRYGGELKQTNASAKYMGYSQILEAQDSIPLRGRTVNFQIRIKSSSTPNIKLAIVEWTGTADSVTSDIVNDWTSGTYTAGNFFTSTSTVVTAVSSAVAASGSYATFNVSATVGSSCNNLIVFFWTSGTVAQNVTVDFTEAGLYISPVNQTWTPNSLATEFSLCRRRYVRFNAADATTNNLIIANTYNTTTTNARGTLFLATPMRITPTIAVGTIGNFYIQTTANFTASALSIIGGGGVTGALWISVTMATATAGHAGVLATSTSTEFLELNAEL